MFNSKEYWENRYKNGGDSGAGSRNHLAEFKFQTINQFIKNNEIKSLIDVGSGDGFIAGEIIVRSYTGYDVSETAIKKCSKMFEDDMSKVFTTIWNDDFKSELAISMDVIFHIIEDDLYEIYLKRLFSCATRYVIIYSSNCVSSTKSEHYKDRKFVDDVEKLIKDWKLIKLIENQYPFVDDPENESNSDFYIYEKINGDNK